jgi:hypothetical protein
VSRTQESPGVASKEAFVNKMNRLCRSTQRDRSSSSCQPIQRFAEIDDQCFHSNSMLMQRSGNHEFSPAIIPSLLQTILSSECEHPPVFKRRILDDFQAGRKESCASEETMSFQDDMSIDCSNFNRSSSECRPRCRSIPLQGERRANVEEMNGDRNSDYPLDDIALHTHRGRHERDINMLRSRSLSHFISFNGCLSSRSSVDNLDGEVEFEMGEDRPKNRLDRSSQSSKFSGWKAFKRSRSRDAPTSQLSSAVSSPMDNQRSFRSPDSFASTVFRSLSCEPLCYTDDVIPQRFNPKT